MTFPVRSPNPALDAALHRLAKARSAHDAAVGAYSTAERAHMDHPTPDTEAAKDAADAAVDPASDAAQRAERDLLAVPVATPREFARKVVALLEEAMDPEAVEVLRKEASAVLMEGPPIPAAAPAVLDPVADAGARWRVLQAAYEDALDRIPDDDAPELRDLVAACRAAEADMLAHVPTSPAGVAALADLAWHHNGPTLREGTPAWEAEWANPPTVALRHLRNGAASVAARS